MEIKHVNIYIFSILLNRNARTLAFIYFISAIASPTKTQERPLTSSYMSQHCHPGFCHLSLLVFDCYFDWWIKKDITLETGKKVLSD